MKRRLFDILSGLSLMFCLATCVLWVRSYWSFDIFRYSGAEKQFVFGESLASIAGHTYWHRVCDYHIPARGAPSREFHRSRGFPSATDAKDEADFRQDIRAHNGWEYGGLGVSRSASRFLNNDGTVGQFVGWMAIIPDWIVATAFAAMPAGWLFAVRRKRRRRTHHLCSRCNYDLRATPDQCPECGAVPSARVVT